MRRMQPNMWWENKKYFSAKTNTLEFNQGLKYIWGKKQELYADVLFEMENISFLFLF